MLIIPPTRSRKRRDGTRRPAAPALVAAVYEDATLVRLTFDRPIDIAAFDGSSVFVDDGLINNLRFVGTGGASLTGPAGVEVLLDVVGPFPGGDLRLFAGAGTGIMAVNGGGTWPGVDGLLMPFP